MCDAAAVHPLLLGVLDQVLGHYQLSAPVGICIGPGEEAQVLHRDDAIYPVPEPGGLGVHLTLDLAGQARFGPDVEYLDVDSPDAIDYAVLAFYSAQLAVLDALDARVYADERARIAGS